MRRHFPPESSKKGMGGPAPALKKKAARTKVYEESEKRDFDFGLWYGCHAFLFRTGHERQIVSLARLVKARDSVQGFSRLSSFVHKCVMSG